MFFPGKKFPFWYTQNKFSSFSKVKSKKKKKKKVLTTFYNFSYLHLQFSTFPFTIFPLFLSIFTPFSFFPYLFFPHTSANISRSEVSGGALCPRPPPPPVTSLMCMELHGGLGMPILEKRRKLEKGKGQEKK